MKKKNSSKQIYPNKMKSKKNTSVKDLKVKVKDPKKVQQTQNQLLKLKASNQKLEKELKAAKDLLKKNKIKDKKKGSCIFLSHCNCGDPNCSDQSDDGSSSDR
jgi:hypothetical protein